MIIYIMPRLKSTIIGITIGLLIIATATITTATEYRVSNDGHGTPRLVVPRSQLPAIGSFWLHLIGANRSNDARMSVASVDVNGVAKTCKIDLTGVNVNFTDWHFVKWILRPNEFSCIMVTSERSNLTSAPIALVPSENYTITPGAGNAEFCLFNVTVADSLLLDCGHVQSSASTLDDEYSCDCPVRPQKLPVLHHPAVVDESSGESSTEDNSELHSNTLFITERDRWRNSSLWLIDFPTPKPFSTNTTNIATTRVVTTTTTANSSTKPVANQTLGAARTRTTIVLSTTASIATTTVSIATNMCLVNGTAKECRNGGVCVRNSTRPDKYYCNCSNGYSGESCELELSENVSVDEPSSEPRQFVDQQCPDNYCQNRGVCKPAIAENSMRNMTASNFTCFCEEGFIGTRCSYFNVCYWDTPCENGGTCSVIVPLDENDQKAAVNASFRCQCQRHYSGDRCEISTTRKIHLLTTPPPSIAATNTTEPTDGRCSIEKAALCKNGATCSMVNGESNCTCIGNFTGPYCEKQAEAASSTTSVSKPNVGAIVGGVLGGVAFIGLIIGSIFIYRCIQRSRKLKGKYNPAKEEMTASGGQTLSMTTVTTGERLI